MVRDIFIRFLGTSSQTGLTRNYSSLLVKLDHQTVMIDCGESTQRQLQNRHIGGEEKLSNIRHILITHLHQDHVLGLVPLLCTMMGPSNVGSSSERRPRVEIYGPLGLRALIRTTLSLCYTTLTGFFTVHELLWPNQQAYPHDALETEDEEIVAVSVPESSEALVGATNGPQRILPHLPPSESELPGMDFRLDEETLSWPSIASTGGVSISAAPILHRCPAVGYVLNEPDSASVTVTPETIRILESNAEALQAQYNVKNVKSLLGRLTRDRQSLTMPDGKILYPPDLDKVGRKVAILGDTFDASAGIDDTRGMTALAQEADVLVHECTNAALPGVLLGGRGKADERREEVRAKALVRGHSTPQVAGGFAAKIRARHLLLNHFSIKYPAPNPHLRLDDLNSHEAGSAPRSEQERRVLSMREIERQATEAWLRDDRTDKAGNHSSEAARGRTAIAAFDGFLYRVSRPDDGEESSSWEYGNHSVDEMESELSLGSANENWRTGNGGGARDPSLARMHFNNGRGVSRGRGRGRARWPSSGSKSSMRDRSDN